MEPRQANLRMRRLAWTFAARIGDKYQICLTRSNENAKKATVYMWNQGNWVKTDDQKHYTF